RGRFVEGPVVDPVGTEDEVQVQPVRTDFADFHLAPGEQRPEPQAEPGFVDADEGTVPESGWIAEAGAADGDTTTGQKVQRQVALYMERAAGALLDLALDGAAIGVGIDQYDNGHRDEYRDGDEQTDDDQYDTKGPGHGPI